MYFCLVHQNNVKRFEYAYDYVVKDTGEYASRILPPVYPLKCCASHSKYCYLATYYFNNK